MKKIAFISDFYRDEILGGGESNDKNLIDFYGSFAEVSCFKSENVSKENLADSDFVIVSNFVLLRQETKNYLMKEKKYIIYEHDHKYVRTRDPSKYVNFIAPETDIINRDFYSSAYVVVVLSKICKEVLLKNIPECKVHNIGCSLWSEETLKKIEELSHNKKKGFCIMKSSNPTKNYFNTIQFCKSRNIDPTHIHSNTHHEFLEKLSKHKTFVFLPTVLETFSRVCVESKMLGLSTLTNRTNIGFFSEDFSNLKGIELINKIKEQQSKAYSFFRGLL